jgi:hypothetical protein
MRYECLDPSPTRGCSGGGGRDNQMSADAVEPPGNITIVKDAVPNDAQDFSFTQGGDFTGTFTLDDDAGATGEDAVFDDSTTFGPLLEGTYSVAEDGETDWALTDDCEVMIRPAPRWAHTR